MFIEPPLKGEKRGWIEVICGSMFSGKTEELIRRLKRACIAHLRVDIFKPAFDTRYDVIHLVTHDGNRLMSRAVDSSAAILAAAAGADVVGIDEAQFFDPGLPAVCDELARSGVRVIVAGLDMDFAGNPFGPVPFLLAGADYITKLHAICVRCGSIASYSHRKSPETDTFLLGEADLYEALCRNCFFEKG
jgi:thymidine kinase